jgi:YggT family protein
MNILWLAVKTLGSLFVIACTLRLYLQWVRLHAQNPLSRLTFRMTDWIVLPLRRLVPALGNFDWASFLAGLFISLLLVVCFYMLVTWQLIAPAADTALKGVRPFGWLVVLALIWMAQWTLQLAVVILLASVLLAWLNPVNPLKPVFDLLADPMLAPFRWLLQHGDPNRRSSGFDFSPIGAFLMLQIAAGLAATAESAVMRHLF